MLGLAIYLTLGYAVAAALMWLAAQRRPLPEGSSLALPMLVLAWPLALLAALYVALGGDDDTE